MANTYDRGDQPTLYASFTKAGAPADPTTVVCKVKDPQGVVQEYTYGTDAEVVKDDVGAYHLDLTVTQAGKYTYRWEGTGAVVAGGEGHLNAAVSAFP